MAIEPHAIHPPEPELASPSNDSRMDDTMSLIVNITINIDITITITLVPAVIGDSDSDSVMAALEPISNTDDSMQIEVVNDNDSDTESDTTIDDIRAITEPEPLPPTTAIGRPVRGARRKLEEMSAKFQRSERERREKQQKRKSLSQSPDAIVATDVSDHQPCFSCEAQGDLILCEGPCQRWFHSHCAGLSSLPSDEEQWLCHDCLNTNHACVVCGAKGLDDFEVLQCSQAHCPYFFHRACIEKHPLAEVRKSSIKCPMHKCRACRSGGSAASDAHGKLVKCLRCATAYHENCMPPAACLQFGDSLHMICNTEKHSLLPTTNGMNDSEELLMDEIEDEESQSPTAPLPSPTQSVSLPTLSPFVTVECKESMTLFPADSAFFSANALWQPPQLKQFQLPFSLIHYAERYRTRLASQSQSQSSIVRPTGYKKIVANYWNENFVQRPSNVGHYEQCGCKEQCDDSCFNRAMHMECSRKCSLGVHCHNQRLTRRLYARTKVFRTENRGWGLKADELIKTGSLIVEYCGEVISQDECTNRLSSYIGGQDFYFMLLDKRLVLDAGPMGNHARFINHSCDPNAKTELWTVGAQQRVGIFATRDIPVGEEISYDYRADTFSAPGQELLCQCGAKSCRKFLGKTFLGTNTSKQEKKGSDTKLTRPARKKQKKATMAVATATDDGIPISPSVNGAASDVDGDETDTDDEILVRHAATHTSGH